MGQRKNLDKELKVQTVRGSHTSRITNKKSEQVKSRKCTS